MEPLTRSRDPEEALCKHASSGGNQMSMEVKLQTLGRTAKFTKNDNKGRRPPWLNFSGVEGGNRSAWMTLLQHVSPHYERTVSKKFGNGNSDHFANQFCS
jgi:hypothetical protein